MKTLSLRPYFGTVGVCKSRKEYRKQFKRIFKRDLGIDLSSRAGRMDGLYTKDKAPRFIVWAVDNARLAHELSHVILDVFDVAGIDPRHANGEPFCYLLSQLMLEAK